MVDMADTGAAGLAPAAPAVPGDTVTTTNGWHGSPKLFAHVVRVIAEVTDAADGDLVVDVAVGPDRELFHTAEDFLDRLSPEALRRFDSLRVSATGPDGGSVRLSMSWVRPWYQMGTTPDTEVLLSVTGPQAWQPHARAKVESALNRGLPTPFMRKGGNVWLSGLLAAIGGIVAALGVSLLFQPDDAWVWALFVGSPVVWLFAGLFAGTWLFPEVEIAEPGHRRYVRVLKFVVPLLAALMIAGLSKSLFG